MLAIMKPAPRFVVAAASSPPEELSDDDWRKTNPRFTEGNFEKNLRIVDAVRVVASELDATPAPVALAWLLAQGDDMAPIPGTKRVSRVEENTASRRHRADRGSNPTARRPRPGRRRTARRDEHVRHRPMSITHVCRAVTMLPLRSEVPSSTQPKEA